MTFGALPYEDRDAKAALSKRFEVSGIPKLIMLGPVIDKNTGERKVINDSVRSFIEKEDFDEFPFVKRNFGDVDSAVGDLNEKKCVIVFHEQGDDEEQAELVKVMKEVAATYDKGDGESDFSFYWALTTEGLSSRIRSVVNMTEVKEEPIMIMLDIPDDGGYYTSTETDATVENIKKFVESPGERQQLS